MRLFFDNNLSPRLAAAVRSILETEQIVCDHVRWRWPEADPGDLTMLSTLGDEGNWVILTKDPWTKKSPAEQLAWRQAGLTTFFFTSQWNVGALEQAWRMFRWLPALKGIVDAEVAGTGLELPLAFRHGKLKRLFNPLKPLPP